MWIAVSLEVGAARADSLSDALLKAGALSASIEDAHAGTDMETAQFGEPGTDGSAPAAALWDLSRVIALFEPVNDLDQRIRGAASLAGVDDLSSLQTSEIAERDWVRLTQSQFDPIRINERLWIVPSWHTAPDPAAINLVLDPGLAFGTGSHPTTFLCLQWLSENVCKGERVLDYGCGSGILAIAARRLGAGTVLGVDIDDNALLAARANALANQVEISLRHSREALSDQYDIVVANILTNPLCLLAPALSARLAPGGRMVLSGVLAAQAAQVIAAYTGLPRPVELVVGAEREGWCRLQGGIAAC